eukprot:scaffold15594_cov13-Tisochrysis_lutea.AAC.2
MQRATNCWLAHKKGGAHVTQIISCPQLSIGMDWSAFGSTFHDWARLCRMEAHARLTILTGATGAAFRDVNHRCTRPSWTTWSTPRRLSASAPATGWTAPRSS